MLQGTRFSKAEKNRERVSGEYTRMIDNAKKLLVGSNWLFMTEWCIFVVSTRRMQRSSKKMCAFATHRSGKWSLIYLDIKNSNSQKPVLENIQALTSCSWFLGVSPTSFSENVLSFDLKQIVNSSLLAGVFHKDLKTADIKPLLEKNNMDRLLLKNYSSISRV